MIYIVMRKALDSGDCIVSYDHEESQTRYNTAIEVGEHALFALLKPTLSLDGNQWCALYGDNLHDGVAGFGDSPYGAVQDFNRQWYKKLEKNTDEIPQFEGTIDALDKLGV